MKKSIITLGLTLIFLITIVACSNNNTTTPSNNVAENEVKEAPVVTEDKQMEHTMDMNEHVAEPAIKAEPEAKAGAGPTEPKDIATPAAVEPAAVEPKREAVKPEVVEPKEQPAAVEVKTPTAEEPKQTEVAEPTPDVVAPTTHKVDIVNFAFSPESLEIQVGDIVEFTNLDGVKHSAVEDNGVFDTGLLGKGESKSVTFSEAGEFGYYCGPHPNMRAKIIVK
jgi:plastocyanin